MTFDEWWKSQERPQRLPRDTETQRSVDLANGMMRASAEAAWKARDALFDECLKALGDSLSLANVPDHVQDDKWREEKDRLEAFHKMLTQP